MKTFKAKILTPDGPVFDGMAVGVQIPGEQGRFEVLANHAPLISSLAIGSVKIKTAENQTVFAVSGGVAEVQHNNLVILAASAESSDRIDVARAEKALKRAEERKGDRSYDQVRVEAALMRALNRLEVSKKF